MADEAETTIIEAPPPPSQEQLIGAFMDDYHEFLVTETEDLFANHNYLSHTEKFDNLARDLEVKASTDGWKVTKTLIYAAVGNTMAKAMLDAEHPLVQDYPIEAVGLHPSRFFEQDEAAPPADPPAAVAINGGTQAGTNVQDGAAGNGNAQTQTENAANGALPVPEAAAGVALPNTGAGAPAPQEGTTAPSSAT